MERQEVVKIKISVIIPCYQQGRFLAEAIDSVLQQGRDDLEVIVVNDGSTDETDSVARSYGDRIVYIFQENHGLSSARNAGIRAARGQYIAFLDSDDAYLPGTIDKLVAYLDHHPDVGLVCGDVYFYDGQKTTGLFSKQRGKPRNPANFRWEMVGYVPPSNTVLVRREVLDNVPPFDEKLKNAAEDWLMWTRIARLYNMAYLDEPLTLYRQHSASSTHNSATLLAQNRYAAKALVESPEFAGYPRFFRAKLLYYRTATAWHTEPKSEIVRLLLAALLTDPRQIGHGVRVLSKGIVNVWKRKRASATKTASAKPAA